VLLDEYRSQGLAQGFRRLPEESLRDCALALFRAAGVTPSFEVARPGAVVVRRLRGVVADSVIPNKCYSVAKGSCEKLGAVAYLEGFLFPESGMAPIGHALVRNPAGVLLDLTKNAHPNDVYFCAEFKASNYCANASIPEVSRLMEFGCGEGREGLSLPYLRACVATGKTP
jgi:hypothetical protein